tara:strand:+ start:5386 stop:6477 length:1092 start_codon:yes stop_codon:yes gene_type:complete
MGGGLMQLVAYGAQDVYLTGNPQITFFKVVYRRHTNFSVEAIEQTFSGSPGLGKKVSCTISRNGDLISNIWLRFKEGGDTGAATEDCTNLVSSVELEIGGQKIDKHYGNWLDIYNELFVSDEAHASRAALASGTSKNIWIPLRFWFCRNPGLALPLIALQYHEVKVNIEFSATYGVDANTAVSDASLFVNYIYLDTDERRRFAQVSHEYLIEQVQFTGDETVAAGNNKYSLNFNHPVKMLAWTTTADLLDAKLQLNGHDRFALMEADYFHLVQRLEGGVGHSNVLKASTRTWVPVTRADMFVGMYSFALKPAEHQPSGTCNFSRIDNAVLNFRTGGTGTLSLFAVNYNVLRIMSGMGGLAYSN